MVIWPYKQNIIRIEKPNRVSDNIFVQNWKKPHHKYPLPATLHFLFFVQWPDRLSWEKKYTCSFFGYHVICVRNPLTLFMTILDQETWLALCVDFADLCGSPIPIKFFPHLRPWDEIRPFEPNIVRTCTFQGFSYAIFKFLLAICQKKIYYEKYYYYEIPHHKISSSNFGYSKNSVRNENHTGKFPGVD